MALLAVDIGTTHCKAALFAPNGNVLNISSKPMMVRRAEAGWSYFDPDELLQVLGTAIHDVLEGNPPSIAAIGIASMAETGLLVDRQTGEARSALIPWFDTSSQPQAEKIIATSNPLENYRRFGLRANFKNSLAKLLWLRQSEVGIARNTIWLSAADYILYHLTGAWGTDYSLAGRTLAFRVHEKRWDDDWLREWGLNANLFPPARPSGTIGGSTTGASLGLPQGIPVAICGHDHVCAAVAVGATEPGVVFDSMGTAEVLIGALPERPLTEDDYRTGLLYGCHVAQGLGYWMGGLSTSGGAIEWLRSLPEGVPDGEPLSYETVEALLEAASPDPTGILFFPYLLGSGSPHTDSSVRGAFIGLDAAHTVKDLFRALLEGVAYEVEFIRRAGETMTGGAIPTLIVAGGGSRNHTWLQIKADVSGCRINAMAEPEATLLGAALMAGVGCGLYRDEADAMAHLEQRPADVYTPDPERHRIYVDRYQRGYLALQEALRRYDPSRDASR